MCYDVLDSVTIATPPTDKLTPLKYVHEQDELSQCSFNFPIDDNEMGVNHEFSSTFESPPVLQPGKKVDFTNSIGIFLTLAVAAKQASGVQTTNPSGGETRSLFDESFDLKEVICEGMN